MELTLTTTGKDNLATQGVLDVEGIFQCYTLELPVKDGLPGSAIPAGRFPVVLQPSPKFLAKVHDVWVQRYADAMPHIIDIPNRSLIMIHWGNEPVDTNGCVLVGQSRSSIDDIGSSRAAFTELYLKLHNAAEEKNCFITVSR